MRLVLGALLFASAACSEKRVTYPKAKEPLLTIFHVDGMNREAFDQELARGTVPSMARMVQEGAYVHNGLTAFPTMTGYAFYPMITGRQAATSGVLGLRWVDRSRTDGAFRYYVGKINKFMNLDLNPKPKTLLEQFPDDLTSTFDTYMNRGAKRTHLTGVGFAMAKYRKHWWVPDFLRALPGIGKRLSPTFPEKADVTIDQAIAELAEVPKVHWVVFNSVDAFAHIFGPSADGYLDLIHMVDGQMGRYRKAAEDLGQERIYLVISDHGLSDVSTNVDLTAPLRDEGVPLYRGTSTHLFKDQMNDPLSTYDGYRGLYVINGNGLVYLYFTRQGAEGFKTPLREAELRGFEGDTGKVDLVKTTALQDGIDFVVFRGNEPGVVVVLGKSGRGEIRKVEGGIRYDAVGVCPLGLLPLGLTGRAMSDASWLEATHAAAYPDAPVQIYRLMENDDAGDIVVLSKDGYDLAPDYEFIVDNYRGAHGGIMASHMQVPFILAGPGVAKGVRLETARVEDVGMTLHELMGVPVGDCPTCGKLLRPVLADPP